MVKYPTGLDTDAELPRVEDNITEIGGEAINSLRAAVFAIEKALGIRPQGTAADLAARLGASLDNNGNIKASALSGIGLVTLPITNAQVGAAAGIEESKLDLNYGTALLKSWIDSLRVRVDALEIAVAQDIYNLGQHIAHPSNYGRHDAYDIDVDHDIPAAGNVHEYLLDLHTRIEDHISDPVDAHPGSAISLDPDRFTSITAEDVQTGAEQLEALQLVEIIRHRDRQHGNGILGTQDVSIPGTDHSFVVLGPNNISLPVVGDTSVTFTGAYSAAHFATILRNDRIDLILDNKKYTFVVAGIQALSTGNFSTNTVEIFGSIPVTPASTALATVYRNAEETIEPSVAIPTMRNDTVGWATMVQLIHPSAAYVLGSGFNGWTLQSSSSFRVRYLDGAHDGYTTDLDIGAAMASYLPGTPSAWTVENVARTINTTLFAPNDSSKAHYPLVAFSYAGELGIALDNPDQDGYVEVVSPSGGNNALPALGFISGRRGVSLAPRNLYIDGCEFSGFHTILDAYGYIDNTSDVVVPGVDLEALGVFEGALVHITRRRGVVTIPPSTDDGTYVVDTILSGNKLRFSTASEHSFPPSSYLGGLDVRIYADHFSLPDIPDLRTLYELGLEGYGSGAALRGVPRALYKNHSGLSLEEKIDIVAVSRNLGDSLKRLYYDATAHTLQLGARSVSPNGGPLATVPTPATTNRGFKVRVYAEDGAEYIDLEIADQLPTGDGTLDIVIRDRISEERFLQVATVLHNRSLLKHLGDRRPFGTVGRQDVRDDFIRDLVTYPRSLLRGNGVLRGFSVSAGTLPSAGPLVVEGGECLVNGKVKSLVKTSIEIPNDTLVGTTSYNLFVDSAGVLRFLQDDVNSGFITPSLEELLSGTTETVLAQVDISSANNIIDIRDLRRFVNDIDNKLDLLVEENSITNGSFASLKAATDYLNSLPDSAASSRRIRIRGEVFLSESIYMPRNTELVGDGYGSAGASGRSARITYLTSDASIGGEDGLFIRDLAFFRSSNLPNGFIYAVDSFSYLTIENCVFEFQVSGANNNAMVFESGLLYSKIRGNVFRNVATGIQVQGTTSYSKIEDNFVDGMLVNGVYLNQAYDVSVSGNAMRTSSTTMSSGTAFIRLGTSSGTIHSVWVRDNFLLYSGIQIPVADMAMINADGTGVDTLDLMVEQNIMVNGTSGTGFALGFLCSPVSDTAVGVTVRDNHLLYFSNATVGKGIALGNCPQVMVVDNLLVSCHNALVISGGSEQAIVASNIVQDGTGVALYLDDCFGMSVLGNRLSTVGDDFCCRLGADASFGTVCGNLFDFLGSSVYALLYHSGEGCVLNGNKFVGTTFTSLVPLVLDGNGNLVTANTFSVTTTGNMIGDGGSGNIDVLNKGQTYSVVVPIINGREGRNSTTGLSSWNSASDFSATNDTWTAVYTYLNIAFGTETVPAGATISQIEVHYSLSGGNTSKLTLGWYRKRWPNVSDTIVDSSAVGQAVGFDTETLTPGTAPIMAWGDVHRVEANLPSGADVWTAYIYNMRVTYIL